MFPLIRLFPSNSNINLLGYRRITLIASVLLVALSLGMFFSRGLNLGLSLIHI